jgi:CheY-like chemotaxis protein
MQIFCDLCSKKMRVSGSYPVVACLRSSDRERRIALCSPVCVLRLLWIVGLPPDAVALEHSRHGGQTEDAPAPADDPIPAVPEHCWVMVVEDDLATREAMTCILEETGYSVVALSDGREALTFLKSTQARPCVIFLDLVLPVMDGLAFRRRQMEDPHLADIPVVVVTGSAPPPRALYGAEVVRKPVRLERLVSLVAARCPNGCASPGSPPS